MSVARNESPIRQIGDSYPDRDELVAEICGRLEQGEPLAHICNGASWLPDTRTLWDWERQDDAIANAITRARQLGAHAMASNLLKVANGEVDFSSGDVKRDKLIVDTSLSLLAKWTPRLYGDNLQLRLADADGKKLDTAPLVGELLGMLAGGAATGNEPAAMRNVTPVIEHQPAQVRAFDNPAYKPRAKRNPPPDVDDLV